MPRALHARGELECLVTEAWGRSSATSPFGWLRAFRQRFHAELADAKVRSWNLATIAFEMQLCARRVGGWRATMARNKWFQRRVAKIVRWGQAAGELRDKRESGRPVIFSYSYAADTIFRAAKQRGWRTVLGQIDAGPEHYRRMDQLAQRWPEWGGERTGPPEGYWRQWRSECDLADLIVVNSVWVRSALKNEGVSSEKLRIVPLAYRSSAVDANVVRSYPERFSVERPLRLLFLGRVNLGKGIALLCEVMASLEGSPIELSVVGPSEVEVPARWQGLSNVRWIGKVNRNEVGLLYRAADVFVFPTFSDGFGLTQLEAQAWLLPVVASTYCGDVVRDGVNGMVLGAMNAATWADAIRCCLRQPAMLQRFSEASLRLGNSSIRDLGARFADIVAEE